jgi:hypothetical protein
MRTFAAVTTMNRDYYDAIGQHMLASFVRYWPRDFVLYVYTEGFDLPIMAQNIVTRDLYQEVGPRLEAFLNWRGKHHTRKFAFKAYTWIRATESLTEDVLLYLDADTETKKTVPQSFIDGLIPTDTLLAYMYARATSIDQQGREQYFDNAETCIYAFNQRHTFAAEFMRRYTEIYETREIANSAVFRKSHDTWVMAECVRFAEANGAVIKNLHPQKDRRTPIKATELWPYFNHYKGKTKFMVQQ